MTRTRTIDRLGLMGIASAIALSAAMAVGGAQPAWSADKNALQWQQQQHNGNGNNRGGQVQNRNGGQNGNNRYFTQNNNGQQWQNRSSQNGNNRNVTQNYNGQQWQNRSGQNGNNRYFTQNNNGQQWQNRSGQNGNNRYFTQNNNGQQWQNRSGQNGNNRYFTQNNNGQQWYRNGQNNGQFVQQNQWGSNNHRNFVAQRYDWHNYRQGHRPPEWESRNRGVDFRAYYWNRTAQVRYHYDRPYYPPNGWYYRRWVYGEVFPTVFWTQNYWLTDYYSFGLDNPPYGYVWVRYGPDALLINVYDGQILSVEYGVFYA